MKRALIILLIVAGIGALGFIAWRQGWVDQLVGRKAEREKVPKRQRANPGNAGSTSEAVAMGHLEPSGGIIDVLGPLGDRLEELSVSEGDTVTKGKEIGHFESRLLRQREVDLAQAQLDEANSRLTAETNAAEKKLASAKLAEEEGGKLAELELAAQEKQIEFLRLTRDQAAADLERLERVSKLPTNLVSKQEIEHQSLTVKKAAEEIEAAVAALDRLSKSSEFKQKTATADRVAGEASVEQVKKSFPIDSLTKQLALANDKLRQSILLTPADGIVLRIYTHQGSQVSQRPILQLADLSKMVCIAEVNDSDIQRIHEKQEVRIKSKTFQDPKAASSEEVVLRGRVTRIGRMVATPELKATDPFAAQDRHIIEVRIEIVPEDTATAARFVNLQVDVEFLPAAGSK